MPMLVEPRSAERDNQNSLRKFPFSDAAACANKSCVIPPGAVVDAQLYIPGREPGRVWLSSVGTDGKLRFSDAAGEFAETAAQATPGTAVPVVFTGDGGPLPGGVVVFGRAAEVASLRACGGQAFTADQAELAPAAVAWPGLPGVCGFLLDDGHVVYGDVKMRGENGVVVSTYVKDGRSVLRISAVGRTVESVNATGFVTQVVAESDNRHFVLDDSDPSGQVIAITAAGADMTQDDGLPADREDLCAVVRKTLGTKPSEKAAAEGTGCICAATADACTIALMNGGTRVDTVTVLQGGDLGNLLSSQIPVATGQHFVGYFDVPNGEPGGRRYYRADGTGVGKCPAGASITLYAHFVAASSSASVTFDGYGTLHLSAPDAADYANPLRISGNDSPVPSVREISASTLLQGGTEALADVVLHPSVPSGEVHIGLRGLGKAVSL